MGCSAIKELLEVKNGTNFVQSADCRIPRQESAVSDFNVLLRIAARFRFDAVTAALVSKII